MAGKDVPVSPLAPASYPDAPAIEGVTFATAEAGIRYKSRRDVFMAVMAPGTEVAGVLTTSRCPGAPVEWCREALVGGKARALVVNSGNANAFTGLKGRQAVKLTAEIAARAVGCTPGEVLISSTGVIGEPLDASKFEGVLDACARDAKDGPWLDAARAIMTTDTYPKVAVRTVRLGGVDVNLVGIAKGAGMIAPDMATMLSYVFTDAPISHAALQTMLSASVKTSFNAITVDSDTSTSDTLLVFATQAAARRGAPRIEAASDRRASAFGKALASLLLELAHMVVRDGEGARKFVEVTVEGAVSNASAKRVALSIANSPLVKTAIAGEDANWGRIVMAIGKAGEPADRDKLDIFFGDIRVATAGARDPAYSEAATTAYMQGQDLAVKVAMGLGKGRATVWTCDLTKAYVEINGDYRS